MSTLRRRLMLAWSAVMVAVAAAATGAGAQDAANPIVLTLKDHRFTPAEIHVPAAQPVFLQVVNADPTPEEFEMRQLAIEKVIVGGGQARIRLRPLGVGRYDFIGEYNEATAHGTIVSDPPTGR